MDLFLAICQGLGLALAAGIGGMLVPLFAAVLAHVDAGWDLDATDFGWLASEWFIPVLFAFNVLAFLLGRTAPRRVETAVNGAILVALGGVLFAASLAEQTGTWWPGLAAGAMTTAFAASVAASVLEGAARRAGEAGATLVLILAGTGLLLAVVTVYLPPVSLAAAAGLLVLAGTRRARAARKYEGLRLLR